MLCLELVQAAISSSANPNPETDFTDGRSVSL